ncbi:MAG: BREX protein BrxB domain-containing protein [Syntrophobacteria bacterium]
MSLLEKELTTLEQDLTSTPLRISAYHDLPFAIFRYDPWDEFPFRKRIRLLAISLEQNHQKRVTLISLAEILWKVIHETEGLEAIIAEEEQLGFDRVQRTIYSLLSDTDFMPLPDVLEKRMENLDPATDIVFLVRAGALAPGIYRCSTLLDQMHGRTMVPIILFYPGTAEGKTDLRFMNLPERGNMSAYNYRVKIYGGE